MSFLTNLFDRIGDLLLFVLSRRGFSSGEFVVGRTRHFESPAEHRDRPSIAMLVNESEPQLLSLAKNAVAFFKMSRSILS